MRCLLRALGLAAAFAPMGMGTAFAFSADFSWAGISPCGRTSPAFAVTDAPNGTASLRFTLQDQDAPQFRHGGGTVPYTTAIVPQSAFDYIGPCPPGGARHHYVWTIEALDVNGKTLARTSAAGAFPP